MADQALSTTVETTEERTRGQKSGSGPCFRSAARSTADVTDSAGRTPARSKGPTAMQRSEARPATAEDWRWR